MNIIFNEIIFFFKWRLPDFFRRGFYGVGKHDVWSFDVYLSKVIVRGLKELREGKYIDTSLKHNIDEMIYSFDMISKMNNDKVFLLDEKTKLLYNTSIDKNKNTFCGIKIMTDSETIQYKKGLQLFIDRFRELWT